MNTSELKERLVRCGLPDEGVDYALDAFTSAPSRTTTENRNSTTVRFPSRKQGHTVEGESRSGEYAYILECEQNPKVVAYVSQPVQETIHYTHPDGKRAGHRYTPDFLVLTDTECFFVEVKPRCIAATEAEKRPHLWRWNDDEQCFEMPPAIEAWKRYSIGHKVWTPESLPAMRRRNLDTLVEYALSPESYSENLDAFLDMVDRDSCVSLASMKHTDIPLSTALYAISSLAVYADLDSQPIEHVESTVVAKSKTHYEAIAAQRTECVDTVTSCSFDKGSKLQLGADFAEVVDFSHGTYTLVMADGRFQQYSAEKVWQLVAQGTVVVDSTTAIDARAAEIDLLNASEADLEIALGRAAYLNGESEVVVINGKPGAPSGRTIALWRKRHAEGGLAGLLPQTAKRGNRTPRVSNEHDDHIDNHIDTFYLTLEKRSKKACYSNYKQSLPGEMGTAISYDGYCARIAKLDPVLVAARRDGRKAATAQGRQERGEESIARHGTHPFSVAHIDHTQIDEEVVSTRTGENLGRPYLSVLIDAWSRVILAYFLSLKPPSSASVMHLLRICMQRYNRLPRGIVLDQGSEFRGKYTEQTLAQFGVIKIGRRRSDPRQGSVVERVFGTINSALFHQAEGNTQRMRDPRSVAPEEAPHHLAKTTLLTLDQQLAKFCYDAYAHTMHGGIMERPADRFARGQSLIETNFKRAPFNEENRIITLPYPKSPTRRMHPITGCVVDGFRYIRDPISRFTQAEVVKVKPDTDNPGTLYFYYEGCWRIARCRNFRIKEHPKDNRKFVHEEEAMLRKLQQQEYRSGDSPSAKFTAGIVGGDDKDHAANESSLEGPASDADSAKEASTQIVPVEISCDWEKAA